jgi:hypothetical protein
MAERLRKEVLVAHRQLLALHLPRFLQLAAVVVVVEAVPSQPVLMAVLAAAGVEAVP